MSLWWKSYIGLYMLWYSPNSDTKQEIQQIEFCVGGSDYCLHSAVFSMRRYNVFESDVYSIICRHHMHADFHTQIT